MATGRTQRSPRLRWTFSAIFELCQHEWFALKKLQTEETLHIPGVSVIFFYETSQVDGRTKNWIVKRLLHGTLRHRNSPSGEPSQDSWAIDQTTKYKITHLCTVLAVPLQVCWKFRNFILPYKDIVYLLRSFPPRPSFQHRRRSCHALPPMPIPSPCLVISLLVNSVDSFSSHTPCS